MKEHCLLVMYKIQLNSLNKPAAETAKSLYDTSTRWGFYATIVHRNIQLTALFAGLELNWLNYIDRPTATVTVTPAYKFGLGHVSLVHDKVVKGPGAKRFLTLPSKLSVYISIARIDHWFKNVFVLPGFAAALLVTNQVNVVSHFFNLVLGLFATCLIASGYYSINEWLDAESDRNHPTKHKRPAAQGLVQGRLVWLQWFILSGLGLYVGYLINTSFFLTALTLACMGLLYNVRPIRTKDIAYLDVLSESLNNPLRFLLGWTLVLGPVLPPSSALISYWMGGAFLMAIKRYSEYRFIADAERAGQYRLSFKGYSENSLLASSFFYALTSSFFLGVFLVKYRVEYLLIMPLLAALFTAYLWIGLRADSVAQRPEKLYEEKPMLVLLGLIVGVFCVATFVDIPALELLLEPISIRP